jgi:GntR family transcriptional regulator/MocR family aminotransferase
VSRTPAGALLSLMVDAKAGVPLHQQIYEGIREAILSGRLGPGARLASTRSMAADLAVSRTTVLTAVAQLTAEGYLVGHVGSGTRVTRLLPDNLMATRPRGFAAARAGVGPRLSDRSQCYTVGPAPRVGPARPFWSCTPSVDTFPIEAWARLHTNHWRSVPRSRLGYGDPLGDRALRDAIAAYVRRARGVRCENEQVMVVSGSQQAFFLCAQLLLDSQDTAWIEEPCYPFARAALRTAGARVLGVPVDGEGLVVSAGLRQHSRPKLIHVTPSHQYPLGVAMSIGRRFELLRAAGRANAWVLEDDYDSEYRYGSRPLPALQGLDRDGRVIYIGTFSKTLWPALRIGFLVLPASLIEPFRQARAIIDRHSPAVEQAVLADFINEGLLERHIRRMRAMYLERRDVLVDAIRRELHDALDVRDADSGLYVVGWLRSGLSDAVVANAAAERGVDVLPISTFYETPPRVGGFVLGYGAYPPAAIRQGVKRLKAVLAGLTGLGLSSHSLEQ